MTPEEQVELAQLIKRQKSEWLQVHEARRLHELRTKRARMRRYGSDVAEALDRD
ncbi:hypothetical protein [Subtercola sp. YIM 133946]|uniref:hypothetical protein n=1 Tax=Subtercola sp. YIM 133946 TaxID=3118909 RepID=UPI002F93E7FB